MKLKFCVLERVVLPNLLPKEENVFTLRIIKQFKKDLGFSEAELKLIEFRSEGEQAFWNPKHDPMKEVEMGEIMESIVVDALKKLNDQKKLSEDTLPLYERFVEKKT